MKSIKYIALVLLLVPSLTFADRIHVHRHISTHISQPVSPPTQTPPPVSTPPSVPTAGGAATGGLVCLNVGYEPLTNNQYDLKQETVWLNQLKAANINCVRNAFYGTNSSITRPLALLAKSLGFYVEIGNDSYDGSSQYDNGVVAEATWAQSNHIDQLTIGNESEYNSGLSATAAQAHMSNLSCAVRGVFSGLISYDTYTSPQYDAPAVWAKNMGCVDLLGMNIYADYGNTTKELDTLLHSHWYVSESSLDCDAGLCSNDTSWASGLSNIKSIYAAYNVRVNWFAFTAGGDGVGMQWGLSGHPQVMHMLGL